ncbi:MAG: hypothetical protein RLZZ344_739 [Pseudomonadota bacterium]
MKKYFSKWLPAPETIHSSRLLKWMGPILHQPWLWQFNRKTVPKSVAIGVFWGFIIPVFQSVGAVFTAVYFRGNIPVAVLSTLVTNPFTYAPIYILAYQVGTLVLGQPVDPASMAALDGGMLPIEPEHISQWHKVADIGKPWFLGLTIFAVVGAAGSYLVTIGLWRIAVISRLRRKRHRPAEHAKSLSAAASDDRSSGSDNL